MIKIGFDLVGLEPKNEKGEYFRNNIWWWRRLWWFTCEVCKDIFNESDVVSGSFNSGYEITKEKSAMMAERLETVLCEKEKYEGLVKHSEDLYLEMENNIAKTLGQKSSNKCSYPFDWKNFEDFYEFVKNSGGFQIY